MQSVRVIVCEKSGKWAGTLRNQVPELRGSICETRSLAECAARLLESPSSLVVVEITADNWPEASHWLLSLTSRFSQMRAVAVDASVRTGADAILRSAGAHHVVDSVMRLGKLSHWIVRHIEQAPRDEPSARQWVGTRMPWQTRERGQIH